MDKVFETSEGPLDLRHPAPRIRRWMRATAVLGLMLSVVGVALLALELAAGNGVLSSNARPATQAAIGGLVMAAIGFWDL